MERETIDGLTPTQLNYCLVFILPVGLVFKAQQT